MTTGMKF